MRQINVDYQHFISFIFTIYNGPLIYKLVDLLITVISVHLRNLSSCEDGMKWLSEELQTKSTRARRL